MISSQQLTDQQFEESFASSELDPTLFDHEGHIRLAWIHLKNYGEEKAIQNITAQLTRYVSRLGAEGKYNETLTVAAIKVVLHFMRKKPINEFRDFITEHPRLKHNFRELIQTHYSTELFTSLKAKQEYLEPDLLAFS